MTDAGTRWPKTGSSTKSVFEVRPLLSLLVESLRLLVASTTLVYCLGDSCWPCRAIPIFTSEQSLFAAVSWAVDFLSCHFERLIFLLLKLGLATMDGEEELHNAAEPLRVAEETMSEANQDVVEEEPNEEEPSTVFQTSGELEGDEASPMRGRPALRSPEDHPTPTRCINPASDINARLDTQVEVRVYPCNQSQSSGKKKYMGFTIKPEGVIIQGNNRNRSGIDLGAEYAMHVGRKLQRYELSDTRACQLLVTTHAKSFWVVPAPEAFSRHSGTCRLLGDRKHPPAPHTLQVGDFLRVGSVGVVVIETHDGVENRVLSEEKIQKIMKDTTNSNGGFLDLPETDGGKMMERSDLLESANLTMSCRKFGRLNGRRGGSCSSTASPVSC